MGKKTKNKPTNSLPLVAIDLGSHSVKAMAATAMEDGSLQILGFEESQKGNSIQNGQIVQSAEAAYRINQVLKLLANRIGIEELPTAFLSLGCKSVQIVPVSAKRDQVRAKVVTQALLDDMEKECKDKIEARYPMVSVIGIVPCYYMLDDEEQDYKPLATQRATLVSVSYIAFVTHKEITTQLAKSFDQAYKSIEASFIRTEAQLSAIAAVDGDIVLQNGCALLDLGAQTTTLSIYKGSEYLYHKVVPRGSNQLTRVIEQMGVDMKTAELIKCRYGVAGAAQVEKNYKIRVKSETDPSGVITLTSEEIAYELALKLEDILNPLLEHLNRHAERIQTLYLTGGGSMLQGITSYLKQKTNIPILYASHSTLLQEGTEDFYHQPQFTALVGTLFLGADYRKTHQGEVIKQPGIIDRIKDVTLTIFGNELE